MFPSLSPSEREVDQRQQRGGGRQALLDGRRFIDTVCSDRTPVALIFVPTEAPAPMLGDLWQSQGRGLFHGRVVEADHAAYKRAVYRLDTGEAGRVEVVCYHKTANLLQDGDRVACRGWLVRSGANLRLIQMLPIPDNIVWHA